MRAALRNTLAMLFGLPNALILPTRLVEAGQESSIIGLQRLRQELIHQQRVHKWRSAFIRQLRRLFSPGFCPSNDKIHELRASEESFPEIMPLAPGDKWRVEALVATAVATVREIQVLQAPHIADADEAVMTRMEKSMATSEAAARDALKALSSLVDPGYKARIVAATATLDRFMAINQQIISLSRRNTNVRSLALSLNQKGKVIPGCENALHALRDPLSKRGFTGTR